jgi:DNA-binding NarL/FixJ family response regulator
VLSRRIFAIDSLEYAVNLTAQERAVTHLVRKGLRNKEIAEALHLSEKTVKWHLTNVLRKKNMRTRYEILMEQVPPECDANPQCPPDCPFLPRGGA